MSPPRSAQALLDRLQALDREIAGHRAALEADELTDDARESHRVAHGILLFEKARTLTELRQTGWRPGQPEQAPLL